MAITSSGYPGLIAPGRIWGQLHTYGGGAPYWAQYSGSGMVDAVVGGTRQVSVRAGFIGSHGVMDQITSAEIKAVPNVTSGTKYFMIVARRTYGTTNKTTIEVIDAGTSRTVLPTRNATIGDVDDQPLALVSLTAGDTVPVVVDDLRVVSEGRGIYQAWSELVLQYMNFIGTTIRIEPDVWSCYYSTASSGRSWHKDPGRFGGIALPEATGSSVIETTNPNWAASAGGNIECTAVRDGNTVTLFLELNQYAGPPLTFNASGGLADLQIGRIRPVWRPSRRCPNPMLYYASGGSGSYGGMLYLDSLGNLSITSGSPGTTLRKSLTQATLTSMFTFVQKNAS